MTRTPRWRSSCVLPARFHEQFLAEYDAAVAGARRPAEYRQLHHLLPGCGG